MKLLRRLFAAPSGPESVKDHDQERLEAHLRKGARELSRRSPAGLHARIMDAVAKEQANPVARQAPVRSLRFQVTLVAATLAAVILALLSLRKDPGDVAPEEPVAKELSTNVLEWIEPVLQAPVAVDAELEKEAQNLLLDSQRLLVLVLPTKLRQPLESSSSQDAR